MTRADSVEASIWVKVVLLLEEFYESVHVLIKIDVLGFCKSVHPVLFGSVVILPGVGPALTRDGI
jgi:hypothetical protein